MIQFRLRSLSRREFQRDVYGPGVISLTRIVWGSVGGGLLLFIIAFLSEKLQIGVLYPPLAATCFINATCVYLRVARPKSVIVGHFVSMIGGLLGVMAGDWLFANSSLLIAVKLGLAVLFSAMLMQIFDADHPPAAATAAIPAILPLPAPAILMPFHMAWGGVIAVLFAFAWNRIWFIWPPPDPDTTETWLGLHMGKTDTIGTGICILAALLMGMKPWLETAYNIGLLIMLAGIILLATHHFFAATHQMVSSRD